MTLKRSLYLTLGFSQLESTLADTVVISEAWIALSLYSAYVWVKTSSSKDIVEEPPRSVRDVTLKDSRYASIPYATSLPNSLEREPDLQMTQQDP